MATDIRALIRNTLDSEYERALGTTLDDIKTDTPQTALGQLDNRAQELQEKGDRFSVGDPALTVVLLAFADYLKRTHRRINDSSTAVQESGVQATLTLTLPKALIGVTGAAAQVVSGAWVQPGAATLAAAVNYTSSAAFRSSLNRYEENIAGVAQNVILQGISQGWNPLRTARELRNVVEALPAHYANSLLRSLQLNSYRDAELLHMQDNADILEGHIRIAALDDRTCAACIALHGTFLQLNESVDDHRNGRCTSIPVIRGRDYSDFMTGPEWFDGLDESAQSSLAPFRSTPAKLAALKAGAIEWPEFVGHYHDPVFGDAVHEASLSDILGSAAQQYYV